MFNSRSIQSILTLVFATILAIWLGIALVTNQIETLIKVGGAAIIILCVLLGTRIWVLVPILGTLGVGIIRGFTTAELGQSLFICFSLMLFLMRRLPFRLSIRETDVWALLVALLVVQVYLRNPVGLNVFGAGAIGGRPYFIMALAFFTMVIFGCLKIKVEDLKWVMWSTIIAGILSGPARSLRGEYAAGGVDTGEDIVGGAVDTGGASRKAALVPMAITPASVISCYFSPLRAAFNPLWGIIILFTLAAAAMSGYRNAVASVGFIYLIGIFYHGGLKSMIASACLGAMALSIIAVINLVYPLPGNVQRALSPFPGTWEERYVENAENSTDWRVEMWKEALLTDRWISNKWLGDGLGMSKLELERSESLGVGRGMSGLSTHQENALVNGAYHSGPVQTVRTVGYVGLAVFLLAMIRLASDAHHLIIRCKGTSWFPVALFFGIPIIVEPIVFVFIFGTFGAAATKFFIGTAMIKMLHHNLPVPVYVRKKHYHYIPVNFQKQTTTANPV